MSSKRYYPTKLIKQLIRQAIKKQGYYTEWVIIQLPDGSKEMFYTNDYL